LIYNNEKVYDVIVIGAGADGVAAAIGAANTGAKTLLIERSPYFAGQATHSIVPAYCGFFTQSEPPEQGINAPRCDIIKTG
jgi:thioredoxin reductase